MNKESREQDARRQCVPNNCNRQIAQIVEVENSKGKTAELHLCGIHGSIVYNSIGRAEVDL